MQARAPAKAILSGEHSVVYGMPALALALPLYANVSISPGTDPHKIELLLTDLDHRSLVDPFLLLSFQSRCEQRYQAYLAADLAVEAILPGPADLYHFCLSLWPEAAALSGLRIELSSSIAIGSGMGSSAATVVALLSALAAQAGRCLSAEQLIELSTRCERLQHGRSSGLDPAICVRGGLVQFHQGRVEVLPTQLDAHWYRVDSGRPQATTGSCTSWVRQRFAEASIWSEFGAVTRQLAVALQRQDEDLILSSLRQNHRLLCRIGVVPVAVQQFIKTVEQRGGAAKISGAGAISGDQGGMLLVYAPDTPEILGNFDTRLFGAGSGSGSEYEYPWQPLEIDTHGAQRRD
ncbi:MAG: mevalonate kinase [Motiliproteus sp.]|jgi:mevalonate kinase